MKNLLVLSSGIAAAVLALAVPTQAAVITFEDLGLSPNSNFHTAPFSSGGAGFSNNYTPTASGGFWDGFAYSNMGDATTAGLPNQYSSFAGGAAGGTGIFAIGYGYVDGPIPTMTLPAELDTPLSIQLTNTTYAALSMREGDEYGKKFGGESGNDPDFLRLTISGLGAGGALLGTVDFYLADYRFADNSQDYIVNTWQTVDLSTLGSGVRRLEFTFASSDVSPFGINTPTYFAMDNAEVVPEPGTAVLVALGMAGFAFARPRRN